MLKRVLRSYKLNQKAVVEDARTAGKALLALAFALGVYPGDGKSPYLVWGLLVAGLCVYAVGIQKVRDE